MLGLACGISAFAQDAAFSGTFYLGVWKLDSATAAPWADPRATPDDSEKSALIGKTVTLAAAAISGPKPFACKGPRYKLSNFTPNMLFQGAFEEMQDRDKKADPRKLAASLGFTGATIRMLETGCDIDWHFIDASTAEVALNDFVYTLKKQ